MSDKATPDLPALKSGAADYVASATKALLGAAPFVGPLLAEIAGNIIPNQRVERLVKYAVALDQRLAKLDQDFIRSQLTNENFTDLMEESFRQAARSLTDERRQYLAASVARGLTTEDLEHFETKHLLRILGEINDAEVLILRFYLAPVLRGDTAFREKHKATVIPPVVHMGSSREERDKAAIHHSYVEHLASLGLLERHYQTGDFTHAQQVDAATGAAKIRGYGITMLGRLLLRQIGLADDDQPTDPDCKD